MDKNVEWIAFMEVHLLLINKVNNITFKLLPSLSLICPEEPYSHLKIQTIQSKLHYMMFSINHSHSADQKNIVEWLWEQIQIQNVLFMNLLHQ